MSRSLSALAVPALLAVAGASSHADNCDALKAQIEAKIQAGGLSNFKLEVLDSNSNQPGRVVGNCGSGAKKIVMVGGVAASGAGNGNPPRRKPRSAIVLTECRDGSTGPDCSRPKR